MIFTDSHTHLYANEFTNDLAEVIARAEQHGVTNLMLPAIDSEYHERMLALVRGYPRMCHAMMGLHPTSVKENYLAELELVRNYLDNPALKFCAIGEVGIDLYWDKTFECEQKAAFAVQLELALIHNLPMVIHTRNAMDIALDILEQHSNPGLRGVFHCFNGTCDQARRAIALGFMLGIGGVATYKNSGLQQVVYEVATEHLLLETDAPWLPPVPFRGKRNEPAYIPVIAQKIADIKGVSLEVVASVTTANAKRLFLTLT